MSNDQTPDNDKPKSKQMLLLVGAVVLGLAAGGGGGLFAAQALLASGGAQGAAASGSPAAEGEAAGDEKKADAAEDGYGSAGALHTIQDVVLNPAQSGGTRFLMISVALGLKDEATVEQLKTREAEVRDVVLTVLGSKTVGELADIERRDSLKVELHEEVAKLFPGGGVQQVFFPQYVIQ